VAEGLNITAVKVKTLLLPIIEDILKQPGGFIFATPVDPVALGIPDYFDIIKSPMDLGTVRKKLEACNYRSLEQVQLDVHLTFNNAMLYNPKNTDVHSIAKQFKKEASHMEMSRALLLLHDAYRSGY
jgi:E1A/CREB-binding protein